MGDHHLLQRVWVLVVAYVTREVDVNGLQQTHILVSIALLIVGLGITACTATGETPTEVPTVTALAAYPGAYPASTPPVTAVTDPYPPPPYSNLPEGPSFKFDQPVRLSAGQVSGTGPAGVPIRVVNITRGATEIGAVTIGPDGTFRVLLSETFVGDRIAIMLGDLSGTGLDRNRFLRGPGYEDWPLIGVLFDSAIVEE